MQDVYPVSSVDILSFLAIQEVLVTCLSVSIPHVSRPRFAPAVSWPLRCPSFVEELGVGWTRGSQPVSNTKLPCQPRARKSFHRTLVAHTTSERCGVVRRIRTCGRLNLNSKSAGGFQMWDNSSRPKSFSTKVATRKQMSAHQKCFVSNNYGCDAKQLAFPHNCHVDLFLAVLIQKQWL